MTRPPKKFALIATFFVMMLNEPHAVANPVGEFFKKIGRSISHLGRSAPPQRSARKNTSEADPSAGKSPEKPQEARPTTTAARLAPTPVDIRPAALADPDPKGRRDVPYGVAVLHKPGFVTSPYAPTQGFVDVRAFPSSTEVLDPFTGKIFLTP